MRKKRVSRYTFFLGWAGFGSTFLGAGFVAGAFGALPLCLGGSCLAWPGNWEPAGFSALRDAISSSRASFSCERKRWYLAGLKGSSSSNPLFIVDRLHQQWHGISESSATELENNNGDWRDLSERSLYQMLCLSIFFPTPWVRKYARCGAAFLRHNSFMACQFSGIYLSKRWKKKRYFAWESFDRHMPAKLKYMFSSAYIAPSNDMAQIQI